MKLIVFLGNPGKKYEHTRHNVGWMTAKFLQKKWNFPEFREQKKLFGSITEGVSPLCLDKICFLLPETFMNLSGKSVLAAQQFWKIPIKDILIIFDDKDQFFGNIRFREKGSSGGHNGIKDIINLLGSENVARLKIGVDTMLRSEHGINTSTFVLSNFSEEEQEKLQNDIFPQLETKLSDWLQKKPPTHNDTAGQSLENSLL
ncbi:aminoacyl-tRNA hydrolase [Candidatus Peregrinibacteria bacterium]|nr:MAG: aminoacyl-tRNA hydrolase [Candidatus Peregrinibacteria bacterium]